MPKQPARGTAGTRSVQVHGHRGSRGTHPENTLPAFQEAVDAGVDVLELDLHLSKDDVVVISHDPFLTGKICTDPSGKPVTTPVAIRSLNYAEIKKYDCGSVPNPRFPEQQRIALTPMPTLEQLLEWRAKASPHIQLNIETKMKTPELAEDLVPEPKFFVKKILEVLRKHNVVSSTILQSFDFRTLEAAKKLEPKLRLSCLFEADSKDYCAATEKVGATIASPDFALISKPSVDKCHAKGIAVVPWTLNTEAQWKKAIDDGVDAVITDYPRKLIEYLARKVAAR